MNFAPFRSVAPPALVRSFVLLSICASAAACKHDTTNATPMVITEAPLPSAPATMLGYARFSTPDATWSALQRTLGPVGGFLPGTLAGVLGSAAGVDADITSMADGAAPAFAVVGKAAKADASSPWVVVFRVRDAVRAAGILTTGAEARYAVTPGPANDGLQMYTHATHVEAGAVLPPTEMPPVSAAFGLTADKIVMASDPDALATLGPYAARVVPASKFADGAIVVQADHAALAGPLHDSLAAEWADLSTLLHAQAANAEQAHGRPGDFGDPEATQAMMDQWAQTDLAVVPDLDRVSLALDVDAADGAIVAHAIATALGSDAKSPAHALLANLTTCDLAPLGGASLDSFFSGIACHKTASDAPAGASSDANADANADAGSASDVAASVEAAMGPRLTAADVTAMRTALGDGAKAFGPWTRVELLPTMDVRLDAPTADVALASKATREIVSLLKIPAFAAPLDSSLHTRLTSVGETTAQFDPSASAKGAKADPAPDSDPHYKAEWKSVTPGELSIAFSHKASSPLDRPVAATMASDAAAKRSLDRLGGKGSFAIVLHPAVILEAMRSPGESTHSAAVMGWGTHGNDLWMTTSLDAPLVKQIARMLSGM